VARTHQVAPSASVAVQRLLREPAVFLALDVEHRPDQQRGVLAELHGPRVEFSALGSSSTSAPSTFAPAVSGIVHAAPAVLLERVRHARA
jgi:hypothetical protein